MGAALRIGLPPDHPDVAEPFRGAAGRSLRDLEKAGEGVRGALRVYREGLNQLIRGLLTAGPEARERVMGFFTDALLVNTAADAFRPDRTKVSHPQTLLNILSALLKLCEPFVLDAKKRRLIHPGFVSSPADHGGVYVADGDDAVPRLGDNVDLAGVTYDPKNKFVPQCFFLTARAVHLSLVPRASYHRSLHRQIGHELWTIRQRGGDERSDPNLGHALQTQYAMECSLLMPEFLTDAVRFANLCAAFLLGLDDNELPRMPEHIADDVCDVLTFMTRQTSGGKAMRGVDLGDSFKVVVKLLSPNYSHVSRNARAGLV